MKSGEDEAAEGWSQDEEEQEVDDEKKEIAGVGRGPLSRFAGVVGTKPGAQRAMKGRVQRIALLVHDIYEMLFHDRPGTYYRSCSADYLSQRAYTGKQMTTLLRQHYDMLLWKDKRNRMGAREFEGSMTAGELAEWWVRSDAVRRDMAEYLSSSSSSSSFPSFSSSSSQQQQLEGYSAFLLKLFMVRRTERTARQMAFFRCLAHFTPLSSSPRTSASSSL